MPRNPARLAIAVAAVALLATGCFNPFDPLVLGTGASTPPPSPDSPSNALRLFEWCYNNRAPSEYRELFTDDYRFAFAALDSNGNAYRDNPWTREDELISTTKLFMGGDASQPAAASITLSLDRNFFIKDDYTKPGRGRWYKNIRTTVTLSITTVDGANTNVTGFANFFLARGDSALIPQELADRGFKPDSLRWYIRRWEDETAQPGPGGVAARLAPTRDRLPASRALAAGATGVETPDLRMSWGRIKLIYRISP